MYFVKVLLVYWQNHYQVTCNFLITPQSKKKEKKRKKKEKEKEGEEEEGRKQNKMVNHPIEKRFHLFKPYPILVMDQNRIVATFVTLTTHECNQISFQFDLK